MTNNLCVYYLDKLRMNMIVQSYRPRAEARGRGDGNIVTINLIVSYNLYNINIIDPQL